MFQCPLTAGAPEIAAADLGRKHGESASGGHQRALPPIDPAGLGICLPNGDLDPKRTAALFEVVTAYWDHKDTMGLQPGLVAILWRRMASPMRIIALILQNSHKSPKTGRPLLTLPRDIDPGLQLLAALTPPDQDIDALTLAQLQTLMSWISPIPTHQHARQTAKARSADAVFLGLMACDGTRTRATCATARAYIWDRIDHRPDFHGLWRHIQTHLGHYPAQDPNPDFEGYNSRIAALHDTAADHTTIAAAITSMAKAGQAVPTHPLCVAAWMLWHLDRAGPNRPKLAQMFNRHTIPWLASEAANDLLATLLPEHLQPDPPKTGRNTPCPCGSRKKYKKCCGQ